MFLRGIIQRIEKLMRADIVTYPIKDGMEQINLQLRPNVTVLAVLVPDYAKDPWLMETEFPQLGYYDPNRTLDGNTWSESIRLPPGKWEIIGLLRDFKDAEERAVLNVAIREAGGDPAQNWLLLKQIQ